MRASPRSTRGLPGTVPGAHLAWGTRGNEERTDTQKSWGWVTDAAAAQKPSVFIIYRLIKRWAYYIPINKEAGCTV